MEEKLLTIAEFAHLARLSLTSVYNAVKLGDVKYVIVKVGFRREIKKIPESELEKLKR